MLVDLNNPTPIYEQIVAHVASAVAAGIYAAGEALPSIRALALELVVNPNTVQRAYRELERRGIASKRRGLGVFVADGGHAAALKHSEKAVRARFHEGIATGQAAGLHDDGIRRLFDTTMRGDGVVSAAQDPETSHERDKS